MEDSQPLANSFPSSWVQGSTMCLRAEWLLAPCGMPTLLLGSPVSTSHRLHFGDGAELHTVLPRQGELLFCLPSPTQPTESWVRPQCSLLPLLLGRLSWLGLLEAHLQVLLERMPSSGNPDLSVLGIKTCNGCWHFLLVSSP